MYKNNLNQLMKEQYPMMKALGVLLVCVTCASAGVINSDVFSHLRQDNPVVNTTYGALRGSKSYTWRDQVEYSAFEGIPYGAPPIGNLRFKAPQRPQPWSGIRNATKQGDVCYSATINIWSNEDCLYLNVFTPINNETNSKAVMVFIYGGAFTSGSSIEIIYGPGFLLEQDVIVVTFNYRLGPLGFLSLQNEEIPGNAGLKDQILALKWVQENIEFFGGDKTRVTLFGESAGAGSTSYLHISKQSKGLFRSFIAESGTALNRWASVTPSKSVTHAFRLGDAIGCNVSLSQENSKQLLLDCLRNASAADLTALQGEAHTIEELELLKTTAFTPTIEPDVEEAVISKHPMEMVENGEFNDVDGIFGVNSREGLLVYREIELADPQGNLSVEFAKNLSRFLPEDLVKVVNYNQSLEIHKKIKEFYFNNEDVTLENRIIYCDITTDSHFNIEVQRMTRILSEKSKSNIYNYQMTYEGPFNLLKTAFLMFNTSGVVHADELGYLMDVELMRPFYISFDRNSTGHLTVDRFTKLWTNFAKTGSPTPVLDDTILTTEWKPFTTSEHNYLEIGDSLKLKQGLESRRMKFWNDIYESVQNIRPLPE